MDIVEAAGKIASYLEGVSPEVWAADSMRRDAVIWQLSIIGEAVGGISEETRASAPEIPWKLIRGLRNNVVHRYFSVDWKIVHNAATTNVPELERQVRDLLRSSYPDVFKRLQEQEEE
ncbi:HepT-like ribonuclease domain-containing protein [Planomonospora parontospora]|uniref:HepT-like ribonuclease domain-containing protein n=1 Tax=Planomonospora parontospora TaxID=58119 RepID=UPI0016718536|nr:HepT-like ribonuclease domain-containing protein [Planomonospora parontospora]